MPMGIVSDSDFNSELGKVQPKSNNQVPTTTAQIVDVTRGRPNGTKEVPNALRKIIGEESEINGRQNAVALANNFGISPSSVSAYANGATSTASYDSQPNLSHINSSKERVSKRARNKLMLALKHMTDDKLEGAKPVELAVIARNMSAIVKDMEPDVPKNNGNENTVNGPQFIFYSPQTKREDVFDSVIAKE